MTALGGLGIFLLGMIILTNGLHELAGNAMHRALIHFTRSPVTGAITGATTTAILQSSSATTVAAVGFVGAGLLTFSESLGIIFGANIGTTITGWLVVLLGFKLKLSVLVMPLILIGALLKLFYKDRVATIGFTLAGFSLIFVGISLMQQGMAGIENLVTPAQFPPDTWLGRLQLLFYGVVFTVLTQSSSAGVATALTALFAGAINFNQAAVLVIGMDVGTTVTAAIATLGTSINSRRTGFSHVIYNIFTAIGALVLLTPFTIGFNYFFPNGLVENAEVALVAFHTFFNGVGVIVILPFTGQFARFMTSLIKQEQPAYAQTLDQRLLSEPRVALTSVLSSTKLQLVELLRFIGNLTSSKQNQDIDFVNLQLVLDDTHAFVDLIHLDSNNKTEWQKLLMSIHVLDHMQRLHERCNEKPQIERLLLHVPKFRQTLNKIEQETTALITTIDGEDWDKAFKIAQSIRRHLNRTADPIRNSIMTNIAEGKVNVPDATDYMEALRWLQRLYNHIYRITYHLKQMDK